MKQGKKTFEEIKSKYYVIDSIHKYGKYYELYEHNIYGEKTSHILVCVTDLWYTYTSEIIMYTITHLYTEYELYNLKKEGE